MGYQVQPPLEHTHVLLSFKVALPESSIEIHEDRPIIETEMHPHVAGASLIYVW